MYIKDTAKIIFGIIVFILISIFWMGIDDGCNYAHSDYSTCQTP